MNTKKISKELSKEINSLYYGDIKQFESDAKRYIKAIKERRVICSIGSVSSSGMSRTLKFLAPERSKAGYSYYNFFALMKALGFSPAGNKSGYFRVYGCGMDMIFATNYAIIKELQHLGLVKKEKADELAQMTPTTI